MNAAIQNWDTTDTTRICVTIRIDYSNDVDKARQLILDYVTTIPAVLKDPASAVVLNELADSSVNLEVKIWTRNQDYSAVKNDLMPKALVSHSHNMISIGSHHRLNINGSTHA